MSCGFNFNQLTMLPLAQVLCLLAYCLVFMAIFSLVSFRSFCFLKYSLTSFIPIALLALLFFLTLPCATVLIGFVVGLLDLIETLFTKNHPNLQIIVSAPVQHLLCVITEHNSP